jgi:hypothetical protein
LDFPHGHPGFRSGSVAGVVILERSDRKSPDVAHVDEKADCGGVLKAGVLKEIKNFV